MAANTSTKQANRELRHQDAGTKPGASRGGRPALGNPPTADAAVERPKHSRRDPSSRVTSKPGVNLRRTSETGPLRTAMDTISECFDHCLAEGGREVEKAHLRAMMDAWDLLNATSTLVSRGSPYADDLKAVCAKAVKDCEESCEEFEDDATVTACADVCREAYEHLVA